MILKAFNTRMTLKILMTLKALMAVMTLMTFIALMTLMTRIGTTYLILSRQFLRKSHKGTNISGEAFQRTRLFVRVRFFAIRRNWFIPMEQYAHVDR